MLSGRNSDPPLLQAQQVRDNFSVHKWGNGERRVGLSFPDLLGYIPKTKFLIYIYISIFIIILYQFLIICSSKVLLL